MMFYKENNNMKVTKEQLKQIIQEEIESIVGESTDDEGLEEGMGDDPECTKFAQYKWKLYSHLGGSPSQYYEQCMEKKGRSQGSTVNMPSSGWPHKSSLKWDQDIRRLEESKKFTKSSLQDIIREEIKNLLKRK